MEESKYDEEVLHVFI